jgi:carbamoyltransferase
MWNPDAVMRIDPGNGSVDVPERFDKAAATQLVVEDALLHIVGHMIRKTGSRHLVLTGGTALNAIANIRLMQHFNAKFYQRELGRRQTTLHVWVPPVPGDAGVAAGAAYQFALDQSRQHRPQAARERVADLLTFRIV